jgi:hypothetical protein
MEFIYTPQQLAGYKGYNQRVRIGNWTEDQVQIDSRIADYIHKKKSGSLKCTQAEARFTKVCAPLELNGQDDVIRFGENVMLFNEESNGCVAYDTQEKIANDAWAVSTTWYTEACARTVFQVCGRRVVLPALYFVTLCSSWFRTPARLTARTAFSRSMITRFTLARSFTFKRLCPAMRGSRCIWLLLRKRRSALRVIAESRR